MKIIGKEERNIPPNSGGIACGVAELSVALRRT